MCESTLNAVRRRHSGGNANAFYFLEGMTYKTMSVLPHSVGKFYSNFMKIKSVLNADQVRFFPNLLIFSFFSFPNQLKFNV